MRTKNDILPSSQNQFERATGPPESAVDQHLPYFACGSSILESKAILVVCIKATNRVESIIQAISIWLFLEQYIPSIAPSGPSIASWRSDRGQQCVIAGPPITYRWDPPKSWYRNGLGTRIPSDYHIWRCREDFHEFACFQTNFRNIFHDSDKNLNAYILSDASKFLKIFFMRPEKLPWTLSKTYKIWLQRLQLDFTRFWRTSRKFFLQVYQNTCNKNSVMVIY